jgi:hypothetical protein
MKNLPCSRVVVTTGGTHKQEFVAFRVRLFVDVLVIFVASAKTVPAQSLEEGHHQPPHQQH